MLDAMHAAQLAEHGGSPGVRDAALLESALARPRHKLAYGASADIPALAAAYAYGLAKNHGYVDGNKRVAFLAAYVFPGLNRFEIDVDETEVVDIMERVAAGTMSEPQLVAWFRRVATG